VTDQVVLLVLGFVLTTVVGGVLAYGFQARAWKHQHDTARRDNEREQALKTFEEVSTRMDTRLFRMRRLYWACFQKAFGTQDEEDWNRARADYSAAVFEWNDNLNRTLALAQTYFGGALRQELEDGIYEEFAALGRAMTAIVRWVESGVAERRGLNRFGHRLNSLSKRVYAINVHMLQMLEEDRLGNNAPGETARPPSDVLPPVELGSRGTVVRRLQERLRKAGRDETPVDGDYGPKTRDSVLAFQRSASLSPDGIVGPLTWAALTERTENQT